MLYRCRLLLCVCGLIPALTWSTTPVPDGSWRGQLRCSASTSGTSPAYVAPWELVFRNGQGQGLNDNAQTREALTAHSAPQGGVNVQADGQWKTQPERRWSIRMQGQLDGERLNARGKMWGPDGQTVVREHCEVNLTKAGDAQPAAVRPVMSVHVVTPLSGNDTGSVSAVNNSLLLLKDNKTYLPDSWLLGRGQAWHHQVPAPLTAPPPVLQRPPTEQERSTVDAARALLARYDMKVIALIDKGQVVDISARAGIDADTLLLSASMGKTVTAMATGKALCEGKLALTHTAAQWIPALQGTALGKATLRQLLMMTSGTTEPGTPQDATGITRDEVQHYLEGPGNLEQLLASPRISAAQKGRWSDYPAGERYSYKSTDPFTVAMMTQYAVGMPMTQWVAQKLLADIGIEGPAIFATDRKGHFVAAEGGIRLTLVDWIRLAVYMQQERSKPTCFGNYLKALSQTQIKLAKIEGINGYFNGYGYLTWTENDLVPRSFWAVGYGGQRIGWSTDPANQRIFITFGNSSDKSMQHIYPVANRWINPS